MRKNEPDCVADTSILRGLGDWHPIPWKKGVEDMINKMRKFGGGVIHPVKFTVFMQGTYERRCAA